MGRRLWLVLWTVFVLLGHLVFDANTLYQQALSRQPGAYALSERRLTDRVVLVVLDSWALRTLADDRLMPKLYARQKGGASGVLWAPRGANVSFHGGLAWLPLVVQRWPAVAVAAVCLLIQIGQSAVRASLAFAERSHQYDYAAFSMLVHTGLLILGMLAYGPLRRLRLVQTPPAISP